jgi:hypothetical protein
MTLDELEVQFYGNDEEWVEYLRYLAEEGELDCCAQHLQLSARPRSQA